MMQPLDGVRVIDISTILAGPLCCRILGDYGAEVIKIEHPDNGDAMRGHGEKHEGVSLWWKEISRNKQTVAANLSTPEGAEVLKRLVRSSDIVVENFRPGTLERWGIGPEVLRAINPALVVVRITGFGQTGPYSHRPGFGTLAESMSGFAHLTGQADGPPTLPAFGLADSICGIASASAALMALRHAEATGDGQVIDMNILQPMLDAVGPGPLVYDKTGIVGHRHGNTSTNNAPRNTYLTKDGQWVAVSTSAQSIAERVMQLVGHPEVTTEPWFATGVGRAAHGAMLDGYVGDWIAARDRDEVIAQFDEAQAAIAPIYDAKDVVADPHIQQTDMLTRVLDDDLGDMLQHNVMWKMSKTPGAIRFTGRGLGQDTRQVLEGLDFNAEEIAVMLESGNIR